MMNLDLLTRALALAGSIPDLHEISYHMGQVGVDATPDGMHAEFRRGQTILAEATALAIEIERALATERAKAARACMAVVL